MCLQLGCKIMHQLVTALFKMCALTGNVLGVMRRQDALIKIMFFIFYNI